MFSEGSFQMFGFDINFFFFFKFYICRSSQLKWFDFQVLN